MSRGMKVIEGVVFDHVETLNPQVYDKNAGRFTATRVDIMECQECFCLTINPEKHVNKCKEKVQ